MVDIASPIVIGIFSNVFYRVGELAFSKLLRLRNIERTLLAGYHKDKPLQVAIDDFRTILSTLRGISSTKHDTLISQLQTSGLLQGLLDSILIGRENKNIENEIKSLYEAFYKNIDQLGSEQFYKTLSLSLHTTYTFLCKDTIILSSIRAQTSYFDGRLRAITDSLSTQAKTLDKNPFHDPDSYRTGITTLTKQIKKEHSHLRIETNKGMQRRSLQSLFVAPRLSYYRPTQSKDPHALETSILQAYAETGKTHPRELNQISYQILRESFNRVVILGDPGGGKSTLCQKLCYDLAQHLSHSINNPNTLNINISTHPMPVRVVIRHFERVQNNKPQLNLVEYISNELLHLYSSLTQEEMLQATIYLLRMGHIAVFFDGLDEIMDISRRREFVNLVESFSTQFSLCSVIVTSRIIGYDNAPLSDDFEVMIIDRLSNDDIQEFVKKYLSVFNQGPKSEYEQTAETFMAQTERSARDLRVNPLLLSLMSFLFAATGNIPRNRPEIYQQCATLMFEKWDQNRDIRAKLPDSFEVLDVFAVLAHKIYGDDELEDGVTKLWINENLSVYFKTWHGTARPDEFRKSAKLLLDYITGRSWLMTEFGPDLYKFTHRTFLEYFYAYKAVELYDGLPELFRMVLSKISKGQWDVVGHLALHMKVFRKVELSEKLSKLFIEHLSRLSDRGSKSINATLFASQSFEYISCREDTLTSLAEMVLRKAFSLAQSGPNSRAILMDIVGHVADGSASSAIILERCVEQALLENLSKKGDEFLLAFAVIEYSLGGFLLDNPVDATRTISRDLAVKIKKNCADSLMKNQMLDVRVARSCISWGHGSGKELLDEHGLRLIFGQSSWRKGNIDIAWGLFPFVVEATGIFNEPRPGSKEVLEIFSEFFIERKIMVSSWYSGDTIKDVIEPTTLWTIILGQRNVPNSIIGGLIYLLLFCVESNVLYYQRFEKGKSPEYQIIIRDKIESGDTDAAENFLSLISDILDRVDNNNEGPTDNRESIHTAWRAWLNREWSVIPLNTPSS